MEFNDLLSKTQEIQLGNHVRLPTNGCSQCQSLQALVRKLSNLLEGIVERDIDGLRVIERSASDVLELIDKQLTPAQSNKNVNNVSP